MKKLNVGDRVKMVRPSCYSFDREGNTGKITNAYDGLLLVEVDGQRNTKYGDGWAYFESAENWELLKEESKMAKFKVGDRVRMVKLRSDGLSYSFDKIGNEGVVTGIGSKFIQVDVHCKANTWEGNGWTYPLNLKCWELVEEEKEMPKCKFKVGDLVKGNDPHRYFYTDDKMTKGVVIEVHDHDDIRVKILEHSMKEVIGDAYNVDPQYFDFYEEPKREVNVAPKFKVGDKVKVVRLNSDFDYLDYPGEKNIGMVGTIHELLPTGCTIDCEFEIPLWFHYDALELVQNEKSKTTVLKLGEYKIVFNGDTTVVTDGTRKGVAKRHPDDEYSAIVGLQVALERFNGGRKPRIGDMVRVLKVDGGSRYGRHSYSVGEIVTVINFANSDTDICCKDRSSFRQTLIAGEYEVLG